MQTRSITNGGNDSRAVKRLFTQEEESQYDALQKEMEFYKVQLFFNTWSGTVWVMLKKSNLLGQT